MKSWVFKSEMALLDYQMSFMGLHNKLREIFENLNRSHRVREKKNRKRKKAEPLENTDVQPTTRPKNIFTVRRINMQTGGKQEVRGQDY